MRARNSCRLVQSKTLQLCKVYESAGQCDAGRAGSLKECETPMSAISGKSVAVVGLGYVGLSLARVFVRAGFLVAGIDVSHEKVQALRQGRSPITDVSDEDVVEMLNNGFEPTSAFDTVGRCSSVIFALPTPLGKNKKPDLEPLLTAVRSASAHFRAGQLWVVESTVFPGVTEGPVLDSFIASAPGDAGDIFLAYSPERIDPGNVSTDLTGIPKIVAGRNNDSLLAAVDLYRHAGFDVVQASSIRAAEAAKLLENTYRALNLALVNELVQLVSPANIDFREVVRLSETKPFGFAAFWPGPGVGGHCIPVDPWYLQSFLGDHGMISPLVDLALSINSQMPHRVAQRILDIGLSDGILSPQELKINLLGMTYKANVNDFRDSPGPEILEVLAKKGVEISYHDPFLETSLPGSSGHWIAGNIDIEKLRGMTIILQNHREYFDQLSADAQTSGLYSAAAGRAQIGKSIWSQNLPNGPDT